VSVMRWEPADFLVAKTNAPLRGKRAALANKPAVTLARNPAWMGTEKSANLYSTVRRPGTLLGCSIIRSGRRPFGAARPSFSTRGCFAKSQAMVRLRFAG
jgi:hypothetical protein